ncbi:MAG: hypothetical protein RSB38_01175 [Oscillospiraceae bacterium]
MVVLIYFVVQRGNIVAMFAKRKYAKADYPGSLKIFKIADKVGNMSVSNKLLYGYNCLRCGNVTDARTNLNLARMLAKRGSAERFKIKSLLALVEWKDGNLNEAIEMYEEILADDYKNTNVYQNLGILYNLSDQKEKALAFNLEASEYNDDDSIIMDNLADAYFINGDYEKSCETYEKLHALDPPPKFPEAFYGYGRVLIKLGDTTKGLELIKESLDKKYSFLSIRQRDEIEKMYEELQQ